jgi:Tol biopolymer transport system component
MADIRTRFREADRITAPDLWPDITARRPVRGAPSGTGRPRVAIAVLALALAGVGIFAMARAFLGPAEEPSRPVGPGPTRFVPVPKENGRIAFTRIDPDSLARDGAIPRAALFSINPDGTDLVRLTEFGYLSDASWSPDGKLLAVGGSWEGVPSGLFALSPDGTEVTRLASCGRQCDGEGAPEWSPDGTRLAFWSSRDRREGLWTINADGSGLTLLAEGLEFGSPAWSPDGQLIAISGDTPDDPKSGIFLVNAHTGMVVRAIHPRRLTPTDVAWSPDGRWLAFAAHKGENPVEGGIYLIRPDGTELGLLASLNCADVNCWERSPTWSPDGRFIALARVGNELDPQLISGDLFIVDVQTGDVHQLTRGPNPDCCPTWQPVISK